jgi:3',5'-cyclic-AMP phosphodiesterase
MTRFLHVTDVHLTAGSGRPREPLAALERLVALARELRPPPDFVVISGDLTDEGDRESYAALKDCLAALDTPVILALGNHDDRAAFRDAFPGHPGAAQAPLDHDRLIGGVHVIVLDTSEPGRSSGTLGREQLTFVDAALARHPGATKVLVMHHPPAFGTAPGQTWAQLSPADTVTLGDRIAGRGVALVLSGHVHLDRMRLWRGVPVVSTAGLDAAVDPLAPEAADGGLRFVAGASFALCDVTAEGIDVTFLPVAERTALRSVPGRVMRSLL